MEKVFRRNEDENQFELLVDGRVVSVVGYETRDAQPMLLHTATDPADRRRGYAHELVEWALADISMRGLTATIRCPFIRSIVASTARDPGGQRRERG